MLALSSYINEVEKRGIGSIKYVPVKDIVCNLVQGINTILTKAINNEAIQRASLELFHQEKFDRRSCTSAISQCGVGHEWQMVCNLVQGAKEKYTEVVPNYNSGSTSARADDSDLLTLSASLEDLNAFDKKEVKPSTSGASAKAVVRTTFNKPKRHLSGPRKRTKISANFHEGSVKGRLGPPEQIERVEPPVGHGRDYRDDESYYDVYEEWRPRSSEFHQNGFIQRREKRFRRRYNDDSFHY